MNQLTDAWFAARIGKATASRMADITARTKSGWGAGRKNYLAELVAERLTGVPAQRFSNAAMQWGIDTEPQARAAYEFFCDADVVEVGFVDHPNLPMTGASPDGLVGEVGLVEIKCPNTATHIDTLLGAPIPDKYIKQMYWQMACTVRDWCDFVSFDPRLPARMQLHVTRVKRNENLMTSLHEDVHEFLAELDETVKALQEQYEKAA